MNIKKRIEIVGQPMHPIKIGQYAWIREDGGVRRTSPVVSLECVLPSEIRFETMNTHYHLRMLGGNDYERI